MCRKHYRHVLPAERTWNRVSINARTKSAAVIDADVRYDKSISQRAEKTFAQASAMLDKFDDFRGIIENLVRGKTAGWLRHRNSLAPIHRLPVELLEIIFHFVLFASSGRRRRRYVARLNALRSVSWKWHNIIDGAPPFWTQLSSRDHIDFTREALQRSQAHSLQLKYIGEPWKEGTAPFWEDVFVHLERWEHVAVQSPHGMVIKQYLSTPAPRLKGLVLSDFERSGPGPSGLLFGGQIADLEEFRAIRWKDISWNNVHCHMLRVLEIEDYSPLDMETLFGIIAENLDLRILGIHYVTFSKYNHRPHAQEPLVLRYLTELKLTYIAEIADEERGQVEVIAVMHLLQRIQLPACTFFAIEMTFRPRGMTDDLKKDVFRLLPRPIEIFSRRVRSQDSGSKPPIALVVLREGRFECRLTEAPDSSPMYCLSIRNPPPSLGFEWTRKELVDGWAETKPDIQLVYWVDEIRYRVDRVFDLGDLNNVVGLEVAGSSWGQRPDVGSRIARGLESPITSPSRTVIGPFLRLKTLRLSYCPVPGNEILRMVKERYARITKPPGSGGKVGKKRKGQAQIEGGLLIVLGRGAKRYSDSITRSIRAAPGVRDIGWESKRQVADDDPSSEESDWYPEYMESEVEDGVDNGPQEDDSEEPEDE